MVRASAELRVQSSRRRLLFMRHFVLTRSRPGWSAQGGHEAVGVVAHETVDVLAEHPRGHRGSEVNLQVWMRW